MKGLSDRMARVPNARMPRVQARRMPGIQTSTMAQHFFQSLKKIIARPQGPRVQTSNMAGVQILRMARVQTSRMARAPLGWANLSSGDSPELN